MVSLFWVSLMIWPKYSHMQHPTQNVFLLGKKKQLWVFIYFLRTTRKILSTKSGDLYVEITFTDFLPTSFLLLPFLCWDLPTR